MKRSLLSTFTSLLLASHFHRIAGFAYIEQPDGFLPKSTPRTLVETSSLSIPNPDKLNELASFANTLVDAARVEILPHWRSPRNNLAQEIKYESDRSEFQSASPVTLADRAAERAMRKLIESVYPNHGIYGEEYGVVRSDADYVWVIDPIDGTRSFITGKPLFGTLVSCLYKGKPVVGIIDQCVLNERWVGISGQQSTLNGVPIRTDGVKALKDAEMYSTSPDMFRGEDMTKFTAMKNAVRTPHFGADCYAYGLIALGHADLVVEADLGLYDYCSLVPILEGAGGVICDWEGRELTLQNHERSEGKVVACANKDLLEQSLQILKHQPEKQLHIEGEANEQSKSSLIPNQSNAGPLLIGVMVGEMIAHIGI